MNIPHPQKVAYGNRGGATTYGCRQAVGVTWQGMVRLGDEWQGEPIRVVKVTVPAWRVKIAATSPIPENFK